MVVCKRLAIMHFSLYSWVGEIVGSLLFWGIGTYCKYPSAEKQRERGFLQSVASFLMSHPTLVSLFHFLHLAVAKCPAKQTQIWIALCSIPARLWAQSNIISNSRYNRRLIISWSYCSLSISLLQMSTYCIFDAIIMVVKCDLKTLLRGLQEFLENLRCQVFVRPL